MISGGERLTLLTVEDEAGLRQSIADYFTDSGFLVVEAATGQEGLAAFRARRPDAVLTDLSMPDGDGLDLVTAIREEYPHVPIIVISGVGMIGDAVEAMKRGANDYLCKPIRDMSHLEHQIRQFIERSRSQQAPWPGGPETGLGLPHRGHLQTLFGEIGTSGCVTLLLVDLDRFKAVRDSFGHRTAGQLLIEVGRRLSLHATSRDAVIHLEADEFALLIGGPPASMRLEQRIALIREQLAEPYLLEGNELVVTASIGAATFPDDGATLDELLRHASTALFEAKKLGKNCVQHYSTAFRTQSERFSLHAKLRRALERDEFVLHYQPQYDLITGSIHGVEALLRWQPCTGQLVPPAAFIPALEESGLIVPVGEWVLREACRQFRQWRLMGAPPCFLSVNVSAVQFHSAVFTESVRRILAETGMPPFLLCLELTESVVMRDVEETIARLTTLKEAGVALSLDDFGTGYSSLRYLRHMPLDELKIDRSFVATIPGDPQAVAIVDTIISMASTLGLRVVAEGIEGAEQAAFLRSHRCRVAQGYHFSRPLPAADLPLGTIPVNSQPATW